MIQRIIKVGNDLCLPLPSELTELLQIAEGTEVTVNVDPEQKRVLIYLDGQSLRGGDINLEFVEQVSTFIREYKPALDQLSKLDS